MIVQIAADAFERMHDADAVALQEIGGADARELQQLRRLDGTRRDDDFARGERLALRAVDDKFELNATTPAAHLPLPNFCLGSAGSGPIRPGFGRQVLRL